MDDLYILARQVLLDALEALGPHRDAVVLVGAQAVYLHVGSADIAVAPFTTDGDLAIDPGLLAEAPPVEQALTEAGFWHQKEDSVGAWVTHRATAHDPRTVVCVDFLVPASLSPGTGRRAARLKGHDPRLARKVVGLEGALVDRDRVALGALSEEDQRIIDVNVAGPAALLVAKLIKIDDRRDTSRRSDKDALDVARLLRGVSTPDLAERMNRLTADERSIEVARRSVDLLESLFGHRPAEGIQMAIRSTGGLMDPDELAVSCELLCFGPKDEHAHPRASQATAGPVDRTALALPGDRAEGHRPNRRRQVEAQRTPRCGNGPEPRASRSGRGFRGGLWPGDPGRGASCTSGELRARPRRGESPLCGRLDRDPATPRRPPPDPAHAARPDTILHPGRPFHFLRLLRFVGRF